MIHIPDFFLENFFNGFYIAETDGGFTEHTIGNLTVNHLFDTIIDGLVSINFQTSGPGLHSISHHQNSCLLGVG